MTMNTSSANRSFLPTQTHELIVQPVMNGSIAAQVAQVINTETTVNEYRVPIVAADPSAAWVAEGADITASDATFDEAVSKFHKVAGFTSITNELKNDSDPSAAEQVGQGLARDIARQLDAAFFGSNSGSPLAPKGLEDLTGINEIDAGGAAWANVDPFVDAMYAAEAEGVALSAFVANPADGKALAKVKKATGSNEPLLGADPSVPTRRVIQGVPVFVSPYVTAGTIWGMPALRTLLVLRQDITLDIDESVFFQSDRTAIRAILRAALMFPHEAAIQKITLGA